MAEATLVPPTPTVNQGDSPETIAAVNESVQKAFDKVMPKVRGTPTPEPVAPTPEPEKPAATQADTPTETPPTPPPTEQPPEHKIPSFIEEALKVDSVKSEPQPDEVFPEKLPEFKDDTDKHNRYKQWREAYKAATEEVKKLSARQGPDEQTTQKLKFLEEENKNMRAVVERTSIEAHPDFQQKIIRPMHAAWNEAARVVKELGGNPQDLAKALSLSGKAQFEALDTIMEGMPESAKVEVNNAISTYRRIDEARRGALQQAPKTLEALKQEDMRKQYSMLDQQKKEMATMYDSAVKRLRDEAKIEVLQKSNDPDAKSWNEMADSMVKVGRDLFLDNTDLEKMALACAIAPTADMYRKLWLASEERAKKSEATLQNKFGSEPSMSESGGHSSNGAATSADDDMKEPFSKVFLRKFHELQEKGR